MDLHGLGALAGGVEALLFSHQSLKGNPFEENRQKRTVFYLSEFVLLLFRQDKNTVLFISVLLE